jgi:hypothetical protein
MSRPLAVLTQPELARGFGTMSPNALGRHPDGFLPPRSFIARLPCRAWHSAQCGKSSCGVPSGTNEVIGWWSGVQRPEGRPGVEAPHEWHPLAAPSAWVAARSALFIWPNSLTGTPFFAFGPGNSSAHWSGRLTLWTSTGVSPATT